MDFALKRTYRGRIKAVIFDMAGTVVDYGSCAPAGAFVELFRRNGVDITPEQARSPMGMEKKDHIRALTQQPEIARRWTDAHKAPCSEADVDRMYGEFIPLQVECLPDYSGLIPGAIETLEWLHGRDIRVGTTTGYSTEMMQVVLKGITEQGFKPDVAVCAGDVPAGRPAPWMIYRCMEQLNIYPPAAVVKIGDTLPDIEDGLNAGVWSVGVVKTGNMLGMNIEEVEALPKTELETRLGTARHEMYRAGAHSVIDGVHQVPQLIEKIQAQFENSPDIP